VVTGSPSSKVWFAPPGHEPLLPVAGSKLLTHWTSETVYWSALVGVPRGGPPPPQQLDQGSDRSLCCEEEEDLQEVEWNQGRHV
jgi:hypothetical protein